MAGKSTTDRALAEICEAGARGTTAAEIAERLNVTRKAAAMAATRLEREGWTRSRWETIDPRFCARAHKCRRYWRRTDG